MIGAELLQWVVPAAFVLLLAAAAIVDIAKRKIPNWTVLGLLGLYVASLALGPATPVWWSALAAAAIAFAVTYALYHFGIIGAGDSKLLTAAALFAGLSQLGALAILTVLAGGALALAMLVARPKRAMRGLTARGRAEGTGRGVPYGVAIAVGAIATQALTAGFFPPLP